MPLDSQNHNPSTALSPADLLARVVSLASASVFAAGAAAGYSVDEVRFALLHPEQGPEGLEAAAEAAWATAYNAFDAYGLEDEGLVIEAFECVEPIAA